MSTPGGSRTHTWTVSKTAASTSWATGVCLVLLVGVESTRELCLKQSPLPVGLQEHEQEDRAWLGHKLMPPNREGRNRTLKHLIQSQIALPICVLPYITPTRSLTTPSKVETFAIEAIWLAVWS